MLEECDITVNARLNPAPMNLESIRPAVDAGPDT